MGGCLSSVIRSSHNEELLLNSPTAKVISINGSLRAYPVPVIVSQVLEAGQTASSSSSSSFLCNSDRLYYDNYIPVLDSEDELEADQIYFILPRSKLEHRLSATDMAALAVRASLAFQNASSSSSSYKTKEKKKDLHPRRNYKKARVSPVLINYANSDMDRDDFNEITIGDSAYKGQMSQKQQISRSKSVKKLQRYTSKRAKMAVRSFRLRLTTIDEGSVL
ncbi:PREDICTED: Protein of unknown function DUF4228 [Prunus dulcis]|uniref:Uncharacterized protein n=1 Tax=Prunus dulcis TaxID=3755 RepID=A0A5E4F7M8_PRUDU|nr:uncharacterized protein LOC117628053 [Prunus dulcis]KAI5326950.1 hypothetical protein L3X38_026346 [Prunus dulcis]VVA23149.1 PREDICTED: Protein of unknown function DUF4228 [Prunus dulcis]